MQQTKQKIAVRHLLSGDRLSTGETIVAVSCGVRTPPGKVEVTLERDGRRRTSLWGASTTINVQRTAGPVASKVEALGALLSDLAKIAVAPDGGALLAAHTDALIAALTTNQMICTICVAEPRKEERAEQ